MMAMLAVSIAVNGQLNNETLPNPDNEPAPVHPVPSHRQLLWQEQQTGRKTYGFWMYLKAYWMI